MLGENDNQEHKGANGDNITPTLDSPSSGDPGPRYPKSVRGWVDALGDNRISMLSGLLRVGYGNHVETLQRIEELGLPMPRWIHVPLETFLENLPTILSDFPCDSYDLTLAPTNNTMPLYFKGDIDNPDEMRRFIGKRRLDNSKL